MKESGYTGQPLLELDILKTVVAIADTGNFSAAAEVVFRTPSAVSMQVKKVEEMLGRSLFRRDSRSVAVTDVGEQVVQHGRRMLALNREMMARLMTPEVAGVVCLGAPQSMTDSTLPELLSRFAASHCCVTVNVVIDSSVSLLQKVREGELDLALVILEPGERRTDHVEVLSREPLTWAGARNGVAFEERPLPVSVWEHSCAWRNLGLRSLEAIQCDYRIAYKSSHLSGQKAAILADLAVAPIPLSACENGVVPLGGEHGLPVLGDYSVGLVVRDPVSKPAEAAADHLRACFSTH